MEIIRSDCGLMEYADLWYCDIKNWDDYRNYRNAFYEFKPKYPNYKFIIPNKDIKKTLRKMMFALQND